jgi:hypothetical protein
MQRKRITLFLDDLQSEAERAAKSEGMSFHQWIRSAVAMALCRQAPIVGPGRPRKKKGGGQDARTNTEDR